MSDFYDPTFYDMKIGPGSRVNKIYLAEAIKYGGEVLELGCGTGNVLLPIIRSGITATGLDCSPQMLKRFQEHLDNESADVNGRIQLVEGTMENFAIRRSFKQIFIPNDCIAHLLTLPQLINTLQNCYDHLETGGNLILDIPQFDVGYLGRFTSNEKELLHDRGCFAWLDNSYIQVWEKTSYNNITGVLTALFRYEFLNSNREVMKTSYRELTLHPYRANEVQLALTVAGFSEISQQSLLEEDGKESGYIFKAFKAVLSG